MAERGSRSSGTGSLKLLAALAIGAVLGALLVSFGAPEVDGDDDPTVGEDQILAVVDGEPITVVDLEAEMERRGGAANFASRQGLATLLDDMMRLEVLAANARRSGHGLEHDTRQEIKHILAGRYRREHLEPLLADLGVSDEEIADYYATNSERFRTPAAARAALLYFSQPVTASDERRQQVAERAAAVRDLALSMPEDEHFGALAVEYSDDQATRYLGGVIGWVTEGQKDSRWGGEILEEIFALETPGSLSELIMRPNGVYLVRLLDTKPAALRPLDDVRTAIKRELLAEKTRNATERFYMAARDNVTVELREERLATVEIPKATVADTVRRPPPLPQS